MRHFDLIPGGVYKGKYCEICKWIQETIIYLSNIFTAEANAFKGYTQPILIVLFKNIAITNLSIKQNGVLTIIK